MQSLAVYGKRFRDSLKSHKIELAGFAVTAVTVASASATSFDLNGTIGPILDGLVALIPSIINLIIAIVPAMIVLGVVGFILRFFDEILNKMRV